MKNKLSIVQSDAFLNSAVLVTGAGGTIGSELVRRINAQTVVAVDISEYAIYKLQRSIDNKNIHCVVGDASDKKLLKLLFKKYKFDYVFNAAAYKHVDTLEDENNTYSVVKNNTLSTIFLCELSSRCNVKELVHISSDKAVNPTNNMGYTKLWCERIVQHYAKDSNTNFKIVRFGNVYNSAGSFVETLQWQLDTNRPITITDDRMKRYFLTISDAVSLIMDISNFKDSNKTYILDMGEEISIVDLVSKLNVNNSPIEYIGIRPGEKLREELTYNYEQLAETENPSISSVDWKEIDMTDNISVLLDELGKDTVCLKKLNEIIITTTIL
jgi:FlaA1/EpsC-like NDP-sugar epimerase